MYSYFHPKYLLVSIYMITSTRTVGRVADMTLNYFVKLLAFVVYCRETSNKDTLSRSCIQGYNQSRGPGEPLSTIQYTRSCKEHVTFTFVSRDVLQAREESAVDDEHLYYMNE